MYEFVQKEVDIIESRHNHRSESIKKLLTIPLSTQRGTEKLIEMSLNRRNP